MSKNSVPAREVINQWRKNPDFLREYDALEQEFALAAQVIEARARAGLTQAELAERMGSSQSAIARLEGGRARPSVTTLEKVARATGSKLRILFDAA